MYTVISPVPAGNSFKSRIRFENLTEHELGCVLWVIALGAEKENCLRIGMAKPYGLGAVRIKEHTLSLIDRKKRYERIELTDTIDLRVHPSAGNSDVKQYIESFKAWITKDQNNKPFDDLERIQELKILHKWFDTHNDKFEYMPLGEFRDRKVLPNALDVLKPLAAHQGQGGQKRGRGKPQYTSGTQPTSPIQQVMSTIQIKAKITGQDEKGNYLCETDRGQFKGKKLIVLNDIAWQKPRIGQIWRCNITPDNLTVDATGRIGVTGIRPDK